MGSLKTLAFLLWPSFEVTSIPRKKVKTAIKNQSPKSFEKVVADCSNLQTKPKLLIDKSFKNNGI